jgi:hypothetical protein
MISASFITEAQPNGEGLNTTVLPAKSAGAIFQAAMING